MKISIALVAAVSAQKNWFTKEWQVTAADQAGEDIVLSDPSIRSGKQWHDCGTKPPMPWNGKSVECNGAYCVAVCPKGKNLLISPSSRFNLDLYFTPTHFIQPLPPPKSDELHLFK